MISAIMTQTTKSQEATTKISEEKVVNGVDVKNARLVTVKKDRLLVRREGAAADANSIHELLDGVLLDGLRLLRLRDSRCRYEHCEKGDKKQRKAIAVHEIHPFKLNLAYLANPEILSL